MLVTGGASFIGSHLVDTLLSKGADVRVADDFSSGKLENLRYPLTRKVSDKWVSGNLTICKGNAGNHQCLNIMALQACGWMSMGML